VSVPATVTTVLARARRRVGIDVALVALPLLAGIACVGWRIAGFAAALACVAAGIAVAAGVAWRRLRRFDQAWLCSRLDEARPDLDDSSSLLFARDDALGPLQRLQRARVTERLRAKPAPSLAPPWSRRAMIGAWALAIVLAAAAWEWPRIGEVPAADAHAPPGSAAVAGEPRLVARQLRAQPPAYTGVGVIEGDSLDVRVPLGSRLRWTLRYTPQPTAVALVFIDGHTQAMARDGDDWVAEMALQASTLYRIVPAGVTGADTSPLQRLDAIPDLPPRIRVLAPERGLTLIADGQREWRVAFEVTDDHGVASQARLQVTRTEGTGENVRFHDHVQVLQGSGDRRTRRFEARLQPSAYGLQRGEDLVARLEVLDNRAPQPQLSRSAGLILRWPAEPVLGAEGLEGMARQVLPAYFRSQRQIIIDAEALLKERPRLGQEEFARRSDAIGVDQRLLRLRYGQFLGEESEGAPELPTSDLTTSDRDDDDHDDNAGHDHAPEPAAGGDAHDHGGPGAGEQATTGFGRMDNLLETFGHTHDIPEAATLLDPKTREILRGALGEMWQSELHLRQAAPQDALPYAHRALELIKQVQQAERIYLARVGTQLPPIDESRRMTGKREGIASRPLAKHVVVRGDAALPAAWHALAPGRTAEDAVAALDGLQAWVEANRARVEDPLSWLAAIDALRIDAACAECRARLRALVWGSLPRPPGGVSRRTGDDPEGRRYLDRLRAAEVAP